MSIRALVSLIVLAGAPARALECEPTPGLDPLLVPGRFVLLGELHGTREMPAAVARIACAAGF